MEDKKATKLFEELSKHFERKNPEDLAQAQQNCSIIFQEIESAFTNYETKRQRNMDVFTNGLG